MGLPGKGERQPGSGRTKGTPNKATKILQDKCEELGVDPFTVLLLFAKGDYEALGYEKERVKTITEAGEPIYELTIAPELRQKSARDACEYIHPKRKAVEHVTNVPQEILDKLEALRNLSDDELKEIVESE